MHTIPSLNRKQTIIQLFVTKQLQCFSGVVNLLNRSAEHNLNAFRELYQYASTGTFGVSSEAPVAGGGDLSDTHAAGESGSSNTTTASGGATAGNVAGSGGLRMRGGAVTAGKTNSSLSTSDKNNYNDNNNNNGGNNGGHTNNGGEDGGSYSLGGASCVYPVHGSMAGMFNLNIDEGTEVEGSFVRTHMLTSDHVGILQHLMQQHKFNGSLVDSYMAHVSSMQTAMDNRCNLRSINTEILVALITTGTYVCLCLYTFIYTYIYLHIYLYTYTYTYTHIYKYTHTHVAFFPMSFAANAFATNFTFHNSWFVGLMQSSVGAPTLWVFSVATLLLTMAFFSYNGWADWSVNWIRVLSMMTGMIKISTTLDLKYLY